MVLRAGGIGKIHQDTRVITVRCIINRKGEDPQFMVAYEAKKKKTTSSSSFRDHLHFLSLTAIGIPRFQHETTIATFPNSIHVRRDQKDASKKKKVPGFWWRLSFGPSSLHQNDGLILIVQLSHSETYSFIVVVFCSSVVYYSARHPLAPISLHRSLLLSPLLSHPPTTRTEQKWPYHLSTHAQIVCVSRPNPSKSKPSSRAQPGTSDPWRAFCLATITKTMIAATCPISE